MPVDPSAMMQFVEGNQNNDPRSEWTGGDWDQELRRMMNVVSRRTQDKDATGGLMPPRQEFLFEGNWMNEQEFNDPEWRRNVYDPWAQGIQDKWRNQYEDWDRGKRRGGGASSMFAKRDQPERRGAGPMGSYSSGGGGGGPSSMGSRSTSSRRYDPAMIARLIGG